MTEWKARGQPSALQAVEGYWGNGFDRLRQPREARSAICCVEYRSRSFTRASARFSIGNAATASIRGGTKKVSLPGRIDNVFVYFGDALDLAELKKLQRD